MDNLVVPCHTALLITSWDECSLNVVNGCWFSERGFERTVNWPLKFGFTWSTVRSRLYSSGMIGSDRERGIFDNSLAVFCSPIGFVPLFFVLCLLLLKTAVRSDTLNKTS